MADMRDFYRWYGNYLQQQQLPWQSPYNANQNYDYEAAWRNNAPQSIDDASGDYHLPDTYKFANHPTYYPAPMSRPWWWDRAILGGR